jgi:hypothetical protein
MRRVLCTIASGPHAELLEISRPGFEAFARRHGYHLVVVDEDPAPERPPSWGRIRLMQDLLPEVDEFLWFDADMVVVDDSQDIAAELAPDDVMGMAAHVTPEGTDPIPNCGVWLLRNDPAVLELLDQVWDSDHLVDHKWWENAGVLEALGYELTPLVRLVAPSRLWYRSRFLGNEWNSVPVDPADTPRIVHFAGMSQAERLEGMRAVAAGRPVANTG